MKWKGSEGMGKRRDESIAVAHQSGCITLPLTGRASRHPAFSLFEHYTYSTIVLHHFPLFSPRLFTITLLSSQINASILFLGSVLTLHFFPLVFVPLSTSPGRRAGRTLVVSDGLRKPPYQWMRSYNIELKSFMVLSVFPTQFDIVFYSLPISL